MSNAVSALNGEAYSGFADVTEMGLRGMITLRGDLASAKMKKALKDVLGVAVPAARAVTTKGDMAAAWMSPDELLLMVPHGEAEALTAKLAKALAKEHALVVNVSDARAVFQISGAKAREVIAKLAPVDMSSDAFGLGQMRRTRLAQIPAAFWMRDAEVIELICFRSAAEYAFEVLKMSASPGAEVGFLS